MKDNKGHRFNIALTTKTVSFVVLGLMLLIVHFNAPNILFYNDLGFCIHKKALGVECPGCGMTRAIHFFLHFEFSKAAHFNLAVFGFFSFLISQTAYQFTHSPKLKVIKIVSLYLFLALLTFVYVSRIVGQFN